MDDARRYLCIDVKFPRPDRASASIRASQFLGFLAAHGQLDMASLGSHGLDDPAVDAAEVAAAHGADLACARGAANIRGHLRAHGAAYHCVVCAWCRSATALLADPRAAAPPRRRAASSSTRSMSITRVSSDRPGRPGWARIPASRLWLAGSDPGPERDFILAENSASCAEGILRVLTDPILGQRLADAARRVLQDRFSRRAVLDQYAAACAEAPGFGLRRGRATSAPHAAEPQAKTGSASSLS